MTRQFFLAVLLTTLFAIPFISPANAAGNIAESNETVLLVTDTGSPETPVIPVGLPVSLGGKPQSHKLHAPLMEELAHIHRFHKERVKKLRKHHRKCWLSAKLLLILCHLALLICGYLHATH